MSRTVGELIDTYVAALTTGDLTTLKGCFHKDAAIIGTQDGLFVTADRSVYVGFLGETGLGKPVTHTPCVHRIWENSQGKIAVACFVEQFSGAITVVYATMLQTAEC